MMKRVTVFCGTGTGTEHVFMQQAYEVGKALATRNIGLVYGGAKVGLMGAVANGVMEHKGSAIGIIPAFLRTVEIANEDLTELIIVDSMHQRKTKMDELSDGVIALPGGFGTLEELFEMLTWAQLGLHKKPVGILNINKFYDELLSFVETMLHKGFIRTLHKELFLVSDNIDSLLHKMKNYKAPEVQQWITKDKV